MSARGIVRLVLACALATNGAAMAQDGFGQASAPAQTQEPVETWGGKDSLPPRPGDQPQMQPQEGMEYGRDEVPLRPQPSQQPQMQPQPAAVDEAQDFGVPPQSQLRPSDQLHAPTPTSVPGGRVVDTRTLAGWMRGDRGAKPLLFHVLGSPGHIAGALQAAPAGQGGSFDDRVQAEFGAFLKQSTGGDMAKPLVFYCQGTHCWMSYNAALRAIRMGYRQVYWYRGGIEAWQQARVPVEGPVQ